MREYDEIADWYAATRSPSIGLPDLALVTRGLEPGDTVLDLGCGNGLPISQHLVREGFDLVGLDSSPEMIAHYRANLPGVATQCQRAQDAQFDAGSFEAVIAWGVLFHLGEGDQTAVITAVSRWLKPRGRFLFTSGETRGTTDGEMHGVTFRYVSLGARAYERGIEHAGMRMADTYRDAWDNVVYVAEKLR